MIAATRNERLALAAHHYYIEQHSQEEVARLLSTSRSNVSRLLDAAREEGIVRFVIDYPLQRHHALERALTSRFGIGDITVVTQQDTMQAIGQAAARWLLDHVENGHRIAIGWGLSVETTINNVHTNEAMDVEVVQIGGDLTVAPAASGHELVTRLARALGGHHRFLHAPALVDSEQAAAGLRSDPLIQEELERARAADIALVGIGVPGVGFAEQVIVNSYNGVTAPQAVVAARLFDKDGVEIPGPLSRRVIAIDAADLKTIPCVVGIARGARKAAAIAAALSGRLINVLICDQDAASAVLDTEEETHG